MPGGLLPRRVARFFTSLTGDYVDFSNFGRTLNTRGLRGYTPQHLQKFLYIWICSFACASVNYFMTENAKKNTLSEASLVIAKGFLLGMLVSHGIVMTPRIVKRLKFEQEIKALQKQADALINDFLSLHRSKERPKLHSRLCSNLHAISKVTRTRGGEENITNTLFEQKMRLKYFVQCLKEDSANSTRDCCDKNFWKSYEQQRPQSLLATP